jgi:hypothetical protein
VPRSIRSRRRPCWSTSTPRTQHRADSGFREGTGHSLTSPRQDAQERRHWRATAASGSRGPMLRALRCRRQNGLSVPFTPGLGLLAGISGGTARNDLNKDSGGPAPRPSRIE